MKAKHWFAIGAGILLVVSAFFFFNSKVFASDDEFVQMSSVVLFGLGLTVTLFAVLAIVFSFLKLDDPRMALGLPDGSIRALLAFSLVLIFVCLATFLYTRIDKDQCQNCGKVLAGLTEAQVNDLKGSFTVAAEPARDKAGTPLYQKIQGDGQTRDDLTHPLYNVTYYPKRNADAADFAKQIFTTLATIFVSVVSFYFGSSVTTSAVKAAQGPGGNKTITALQSSLTNALADSHNAQIAVDQARAKLKQAQDDLRNSPSDDPGKVDAVKKAQSDLDAANADLVQKQNKVQQAQKSLTDAQAATSSGSAPAGASG